MIKRFIKNEFGMFLIFIIITSLIYDYPKILTYRPKSVHQWRQTDCASIALNYDADTLSFFKPSIQLTNLSGNNKTVSEFPVIYYFVAILWRVFGYHEYIFRIVNLLIVYLGLFYLFRLLSNLVRNKYWALTITALLFTSPVLVYYSNNFISNAVAFSIVLPGWYYFYKFVKFCKTKYIYISVLFFLLAGLLKISSLISFFIILLIFLIDLTRLFRLNGNRKIFSRPLVHSIPFIALSLIIIAWYTYARNYNLKNIYGVFLQGIMPIWQCDFGRINYLLNCIFNIMLPQFMSKFLYISILFLFLILLIYYKKVNRILLLITFSSFFACIAYILLFFQVFEIHDYYQIDLLIFPLAVLVSFTHFIYTRHSSLFESNVSRYLFAILVVCNLIYCASYTRIKYNTSDIFARYAFFIDFRQKSSYEANQNNYRLSFEACETISPYLRSLGIKRTDRVISIPDFSINISLYLMDQKGFDNYCLGNVEDKFTPQTLKLMNAKYLIILQPAWLEMQWLKPYMIYKMGEYKNISIFDLRPFL
jgi:hypothetical protein